MKIKVEKNYMVFPVNTSMSPKYLSFKQGEKTVYGLTIKLDNISPNFSAYVDVSRFLGQELELSVSPETEIRFRFADELNPEGLYSEPTRPQVHFSTKNGWINDPNGLVYIDGKYHMFYQHNPAEPRWNNMHWGHAVSEDLIHWTELGAALFPDERGGMFSGSAIVDEKNVFGRNSEGNKTVLLFYTTNEPYCQNLSFYDVKTGEITAYGGNPIIPHMIAYNRDPKVVFCEEKNCYLMALYLDEDIYGIFTSDNMVEWKELQRVSIEGDCECPDIFSINDDRGNRKWVLMGAHDHYLVGSFDSGLFVPEQSVVTFHYGNAGYAGQSFSNMPDGRVVRMPWDRWYAPVSTFNGQMGIPMEMTLRSTGGVSYLCAEPVKEINSIAKTTEVFEDIEIAPQKDFSACLEDSAYLVKIKGISGQEGELHLSFFGRKMVIDTKNNEFRVSRCTAPISVVGGEADFTVIIDRCSIEVFADQGRVFLSCTNEDIVQDRNILRMTASAGQDMTIKALEVTPLKSIWCDK